VGRGPSGVGVLNRLQSKNNPSQQKTAKTFPNRPFQNPKRQKRRTHPTSEQSVNPKNSLKRQNQFKIKSLLTFVTVTSREKINLIERSANLGEEEEKKNSASVARFSIHGVQS
jgi:hypothetical protein